METQKGTPDGRLSTMSTIAETDNSRPEERDVEKEADSKPASNPTADKKVFPETDLSRGIVGWEGQDDPNNPQNFAPGKKWGLLGLISAFTLVSPLASSMFAPAVSYMAADFGETNQTILSFTVSVFLLGYTVCSDQPLRHEP
jgi:hypothetical protein